MNNPLSPPPPQWDQTNYWTESGCALPTSHTVINIKAIKRVFNLPPPAVINEEAKAGGEERGEERRRGNGGAEKTTAR